jgi:hypothetical protein
MLTILSCDCGHRFEVNEAGGTQTACPHCGQALTVPGTAPVTLRMERYLAERGAAAVVESTAPVREVNCPDCSGSGRCPVCKGRGVLVTDSFLRLSGQIVLFLLFGVWGHIFRSIFMDNAANSHSALMPDGCLKCSGRGHCHRCRGGGRLLVHES